MKQKYVIIVAGGSGIRMKTIIPKQFLLLKGKPILMYTIEAFYRYNPNINIILVLSEKQKTYWTSLCQQYNFGIDHYTIGGGASRFYSVKNGLLLIEKGCLVAVHDGVRPLVGEKLIDNAFKMAKTALAVYPAIPITDTLRQITNGSSRTMNRSEFYSVQTPQVFLSDILINAYYEAIPSNNFTDDISVVESGKICTPVMIKGSKDNIKITTPIDLLIAEALISHKWT